MERDMNDGQKRNACLLRLDTHIARFAKRQRRWLVYRTRKSNQSMICALLLLNCLLLPISACHGWILVRTASALKRRRRSPQEEINPDRLLGNHIT